MDIMKSFSLEGKVALVTGGTYGIGFAIGRALAEAGAKFVEENWKQLGLDRMVSDRLPLGDIEKALNMMLDGTNLCKIIINCQE